MNKRHKTIVIGSGFAGLSAAAHLSKAGYDVHVYEKNEQAGGRARQFTSEIGYTFDMGPSWYWMPDVYEKFFEAFGKSVSDYYDLRLLDPSFKVVYAENEDLNIPADFESLCDLFEHIEKGSSKKLMLFMTDAEYKYKIGMEKLVFKPGLSIMEFADTEMMKGVFRMQVFSSFSKHIRKYFSHPKLIALMEFPVLFLGAMPQDTPALYSLMNYAGLKLGTWYPMGGFGKIVDAMKAVAEENGTQFHFNSPVERMNIDGACVTSVIVNGCRIECDSIIASADYHHVEKSLLPAEFRNYSEKYWESKTLAPSCLIYYLGINKRIDRLQHHTLFFDEQLDLHAREIYKTAVWPTKPLFYACCTSKTDPSVAPEGHENLFLLMPIAPGLEDDGSIREKYFHIMMERLKKFTGEDIVPHIDFKKSYCVSDFTNDYNAFKGNAYGLANTLLQTAILKPKIRNKKLSNLFYAGQLTVPGPGVPPSIISGQIAAHQVIQQYKSINHEIPV